MATAKRDLTNPPVQGPQRSLGGNDQLLTLQEVAELLDVSENTIYYWRYQRTGPKGHKVGKRVRYRLSDVLSWMSERGDLVSGLSPLQRR